MIPNLFQAVLVVAAVLCSLVAGFLFAFAVVVMPGIGRLDNASFIRAFQTLDRVIQDNQPLFLLVWVGSVLASVAAAALGFVVLDGVDRVFVIAAALAYLVGVQLPTGIINVPLNNQLQALDPAAMTDTTWRQARDAFEPRWNRWNIFRTVCAIAVAIVYALLLLRT